MIIEEGEDGVSIQRSSADGSWPEFYLVTYYDRY